MSNKTICSAFWHHTNIRSDNRVFPCCRFKYPVAEFDGDVDKILKLPVYDELRRKAKAGEHIAGCQKCYDEEAESGSNKPYRVNEYLAPSTRLEFNSKYDCKTISLDFLEVGFDNICNLMCVMCSPEWSNKWGQKLHPDLPPKQLIKDTDDFKNVPDTIQTVLFLGGEPLMTNRHIRFLEKFKNINDLTAIYNTNGTFAITDRIKISLDKCKEVNFFISVDGYGETNDRVREGSSWDKVTSFISQCEQYGYKFQITSAIHTENIMDLPKLVDWIKDNNYDWRPTLVTYPQKLDVSNLDDTNKNIIKDYLNNIDIPFKTNIIKHLDIS